MIEILQLLLANPGPSIFVLFAGGILGGGLLNALLQAQRTRLAHRERMAELQARTETAKALAAAPEETQRSELAKQLLEAYGEAGEGLQNDEKGNLVRWELSKKND